MKQGIILAAGLGRRLREITEITPKSLIRVDGKPILERNIDYMMEAGFDRVILIVGYKQERFHYLQKKYGEDYLTILFNSEFATSNTVSSLFCARDYLKCESYITTADIYLNGNPYIKYMGDRSFYLLRPTARYTKPDWIAMLDYNDHCRFCSVDTHAYEGHAYTGISHWNVDGLKFLREQLQMIHWDSEKERNQYWDELLLPHLGEYSVYAKILEDNAEIYELDDISDISLLESEQGVKITY